MAGAPVEDAIPSGQWSIAGKHVVITGPTSGIGKEAARQLAARGAVVVLAARRTDAAAALAAEIREQHPRAEVVVGPRLDLSSVDSVRQFAEQYRAQGRPLHVLINNAGANHHGKPWSTPEGFGGQGMTNYLGPFLLTRLLEEELQRSAPSRVINLSSVTHRYAHIGRDVDSYLRKWRGYPSTKLANALFAFELQRRLGDRGVQSCAIDPGGVASNIWSSADLSSRGPLAWIIQNFYAPPSDGASAIVHAATVAWEADAVAAAAINAAWVHPSERPAAKSDLQVRVSSKSSGKSSSKDGGGGGGSRSAPDLRLYARGLFASPLVTSWRGVPSRSLLDTCRLAAWGLSTLLHSLADWPVRRFTGGRLASTTRPVPAAPLAYDPELAARLWEVSSDAVQLPRAPQMLALSASRRQ